MMSNSELRQRAAAKRIYYQMQEFFERRSTHRRRVYAALKIQTFWRMVKVKSESFITALELPKYPRIYLLKEQKPIFLRILKHLMPIFERDFNIQYDELVECLTEDTKYDTIRVTEPDMFPKCKYPLV